MNREESFDRRAGLIVAAASAAVTLAVAITAGALLGYVHPAASPAAPVVATAPQTVLVPVHPEPDVPRVLPAEAPARDGLVRIRSGERQGERRSRSEHEERERRRRRSHHDDD